MLNLDNPDPEIFAMIRRREEYMNASLVIPELFRIRLRSSFNKKINSYGLKNKVTEYLDWYDWYYCPAGDAVGSYGDAVGSYEILQKEGDRKWYDWYCPAGDAGGISWATILQYGTKQYNTIQYNMIHAVVKWLKNGHVTHIANTGDGTLRYRCIQAIFNPRVFAGRFPVR